MGVQDLLGGILVLIVRRTGRQQGLAGTNIEYVSLKVEEGKGGFHGGEDL